ncbi:isoprenylcysteine carboxyl methyltransferase family protein [Paenibacillus hamazuiensis]|uniref:isoprenylcysteine carboxyl methyltransferase family protein n=1 Tax=Paenibacillus hamazuiensis TaxID=2936508 RepID=UPI00200D8653|nr:isoprenylcysteine carboxylmethyltransferase family protein [Paenibacillus hamazuiensis]
MHTFFAVIFTAVVLQRVAELRLARRNGERVKELGGYEVGAGHYKYIVMLHAAFFAGLAAEVLLGGASMPEWWWLPFSLFVAAQELRIWCIRSLGMYWNTRIWVVPDMEPVRRGPYRHFRHPNYIVVTLELVLLPLTFGALRTAAFIALANALVLRQRIAAEEAAIAAVVRGRNVQ